MYFRSHELDRPTASASAGRERRNRWPPRLFSAAAHVAKTGTATPLAVPAFARSGTQKTGQAAVVRLRRTYTTKHSFVTLRLCQSRVPAADPRGLLDLREWGKLWTGEEWQAELTRSDHAEFVQRPRSQTGRERALGSNRFLSRDEKLLGRRVRALPVGRPRTPKKRRKQ